MNLIRTTALALLFVLSLCVPALAQGSAAPATQPPATQTPATQTPATQEAPRQKSTMEMENDEFFKLKFKTMEPRPLWRPEISPSEAINGSVVFYNVNLWQLFALALILMIFLPVLQSFSRERSPWILRVFRGFTLWIRDEMVVKVMGQEDGRRFAPYFIYLFFFIAFMNLLGLLPGGTTATATVFVTGALALITFVMMVVGGMIQQGPAAYWLHLLPHGLPTWLIPLMAVVELIGLLVKPFALTIRLFSTMLAGHLVLYSFLGMIFLFAKLTGMGAVSYATAIPGFGLAVFIYILESFIVLLQAYIFTYLSIIFVQQALHPSH